MRDLLTMDVRVHTQWAVYVITIRLEGRGLRERPASTDSYQSTKAFCLQN